VSLTPGTRFGSFEVSSLLGAGGMGEVYRARDTRLDRHVAIKVLLVSFARDPERLTRFEREARLLASLNHPNIAQIYGLEESASTKALIMELVEGPTLADRIAEGPLPFEEALAIARQVADALQAAHDQGIVHRDLKPANIKLRPDGTVKVLDFGLAKLSEPGVAGSSDDATALTMSPTVMSPATTQAGFILGTAPYMSPEQARGQAVDARADIWAFGVVFFEMLTGERLFKGDNLTDTLASVVKDDVDLSRVPFNMRRLLARCLDKDPRRRLRAIGDAWDLLDHGGTGASTSAPTGPRRPDRLIRVAAGILAVSTLSLGVLYVWERRSPSRGALNAAPRVSRLSVTLPADAPLFDRGGGSSLLALSPDGHEIAYVGGTSSAAFGNGRDVKVDVQIYRRPLDRLGVVPVPGSQQATSPFYSPDGRWLGFFDRLGQTLKKIGLEGSLPSDIGELPFAASRGIAWAADDVIYYGILGGDLWRIPAAGGQAALVAGADVLRREKEVTRRYPYALPDGKTLLYVALPTSATGFATGFDFNEAQIVAVDVRSGRRTVLLTGGFGPQYVSSGHLVFARRDGLYAAPFDLPTLTIRGEAVKVISGVRSFSGNGFAHFAVSADGSLVYAPGPDFNDSARGTTAVWVSREGHERPLAHWSNAFNQWRLSPDGTRLLIHANSATSDVGIHEVERGVLTRWTLTPTGSSSPVWTADGASVTYTRPDSAFTTGPYTLMLKRTDGAGTERALLERPSPVAAESWSPDGRWLAFTETTVESAADIWVLPADASAKPIAVAATSAAEQHPRFSPDGRWIAYESNDSGRNEVFVQPWPTTGGARYQVSTDGGANPEWASDGREIVYQNGGAVMQVSVRAGATFGSTAPTRLFERPAGSVLLGVAPGSREFVMTGSFLEQAREGSELIVVQNWGEELRRLAPVK
jgi:serine/threonine-protein kinase